MRVVIPMPVSNVEFILRKKYFRDSDLLTHMTVAYYL